MGRLGVVELQCTPKSLKDAVRSAREVPPLQADVVVDTHPGQHRDFLTAQASDASVAPEDRQTGFLGRDPGSAGGQELPHVVAVCHGIHVTRRPLAAGYRHIDTAAAYGNEREVGEGIRRSGVDRADVFIETKVWVSDYGYDETLHAWNKAVGKLGTDCLDLLILHQPAPDRFEKTIAAYKALETLLADGRVRAIGVSNFMPHHLEQLLGATDIVPAVNQIELHPYFTQTAVQAADAANGILHPSLVTDRRHHLLPRLGREPPERDGRPRNRRHRTGARQERRPGHAALAPAAGPLSHPEVDEPGTHRRELRRLRLRAQPPTNSSSIDALDTGVRNGPDPDEAREERFAMVIPEA